MTTRARFALWAAVASVVAVLVAGVVAIARVDSSIEGFVDARLDTVAMRVVDARTVTSACDVAAAAGGDTGRVVSVIDTDGREHCRSQASAPAPRALGVTTTGRPAEDGTHRTRTVGGAPWRVTERRRDDGRLVVVADEVSASEQAQRDASRAVLLAMLAGSIVATAIGAIAAAPATRRIDRLLGRIAAAGRDPSRESRVGRVGGRDLDAAAGAFDTLLDDLHAADVAQRRLFADAAHELRTPLTSMRTNAQLLERDPTLGDEARDIASRIARQGEGVARLVSGLVDHASVGAWTRRGAEPVTLAELVTTAVDRTRLRWPDARLRLDLDGSLAPVDADLVTRAVGNLIDNALVHGGGGEVVVELRGGVVAVEDVGPGFTRERAEEAFHPFAAGHAPASAGSGLGLAFVEHVARAHGGSLRIAHLAQPTRLELRLGAEEPT